MRRLNRKRRYVETKDEGEADINTFLTEADQALKEQFEQFAQDKLAPIVSKFASHNESPATFLNLMAQSDYLALNVPLEYGGKNSSFLHLVLLAETLAHYDAGIAVYLAYHAALIELLKAYGTEQQKNTFLPKLASGELLGTIAYLKVSQNDSQTKLITEAEKLILDGNKQLVVLTQVSPNSSNTQNNSNTKDQISNLVVVLAADQLILLDDLSVSSIEIDAQNIAMGPKSVNFCNLIFQKHHLNQNALLTTKINTNEAMSFARDIIKTILAAAALGIAESTLNQTTKYVQVTERNGKPLSQSQAVLWKLANASVDTSAARLLTYRAAWSKDENKEVFSKYATMAKTYASQIARIHASEGMQILLPLSQMEHF